MKTEPVYTAVLADDEPLLLESMQNELKKVWPELQVVATAANGSDAISAIVEYKPSVTFLDIQMPGATGLDVAQAIAEDWPESNGQASVPLIVFATAFDDFAIEAFEAAAVDYLVKPVKTERLALCVDRLKKHLRSYNDNESALNESDTNESAVNSNPGKSNPGKCDDGKSKDLSAADQLAEQLHQLLTHKNINAAAADSVPLLKVIRASSGSKIRIIPIDEVILFESADKYVTVHTVDGESLIREPLKKLLPQLDAAKFEQVHRGAIVQVAMIESANRDETGKVTLEFKGIKKQVNVSRVYRHLFQPM